MTVIYQKLQHINPHFKPMKKNNILTKLRVKLYRRAKIKPLSLDNHSVVKFWILALLCNMAHSFVEIFFRLKKLN